ncbi:MAG: hypothetical protein V7678_02715, partial [Brevundimonas sp.]
MLGVVNLVRRTVEGSIISFVVIAVVAVFGLSATIDALLAGISVASMAFLVVIAVVLADLIGRFIAI